MKLWIDTDVGTNPDDAIALALACVHPDITLVGVSTVGDEDGRRAAVARDVVSSLDGNREAVVSGPMFEPRAVRDSGADSLLAIGPLTNVARVVDEGASPARVAVMGGALAPVWHRGAWHEVESNFGADPAAAAHVLAEIDVLLVPLDVTARICLDDDRRARLAARADSLRRAVESWEDPVCLHDAVALVALAGEPFFTVAPRRLRVDTSGRVVEAADGRVHRVVVDADRDAALGCVFQLLNGNRY